MFCRQSHRLALGRGGRPCHSQSTGTLPDSGTGGPEDIIFHCIHKATCSATKKLQFQDVGGSDPLFPGIVALFTAGKYQDRTMTDFPLTLAGSNRSNRGQQSAPVRL